MKNEGRNSILMTCHYVGLSSASDWLKQISIPAQPIRNTTSIWVGSRHQYGISALEPQTLVALRNVFFYQARKFVVFLSFATLSITIKFVEFS